MCKGNQAGTYGPNIAGTVSTVDVLSDLEYLQLLNITKRVLFANSEESAISVLHLAAKDQYGQIVLTENTTPIKIVGAFD